MPHELADTDEAHRRSGAQIAVNPRISIRISATFLVATLLLVAMNTIAHAAETPVDLAVRFLTNVYTGVEMSRR